MFRWIFLSVFQARPLQPAHFDKATKGLPFDETGRRVHGATAYSTPLDISDPSRFRASGWTNLADLASRETCFGLGHRQQLQAPLIEGFQSEIPTRRPEEPIPIPPISACGQATSETIAAAFPNNESASNHADRLLSGGCSRLDDPPTRAQPAECPGPGWRGSVSE